MSRCQLANKTLPHMSNPATAIENLVVSIPHVRIHARRHARTHKHAHVDYGACVYNGLRDYRILNLIWCLCVLFKCNELFNVLLVLHFFSLQYFQVREFYKILRLLIFFYGSVSFLIHGTAKVAVLYEDISRNFRYFIFFSVLKNAIVWGVNPFSSLLFSFSAA